MALNVKYGQLDGIADPNADTVVTGLGFTPKAMLWFSTCVQDEAIKTNFASFAVGIQGDPGIGTTKAAARNISFNHNSGAGGNIDRGSNAVSTDHSINEAGANLANLANAYIKTYDVDGFTIHADVTFLGTSANKHFSYIAIGGSSVLNVKKARFTWPAAAGVTAFTLGFRPDLLIFLSDGGSGPSIGWGICASPSQQFGEALYSTDFQASGSPGAANQKSVYRSDRCLLSYEGITGTLKGLAAVTTIDANGFSLDVANTPGITKSFDVLAIKFDTDVVVEAGTITKPSSTSPASQSKVTAVKPALLLMSTVGKVSNSAPTANMRACIGAFTRGGMLQGNAACDAQDVDWPALCVSKESRDRILTIVSAASAAVLFNVLAAMTDDGFTASYNPNNAVLAEIGYLVVGEPAGTVDVPPVVPVIPPSWGPGSVYELLPFDPDWSSDMTERAAYFTNVLDAITATEQRIALRSLPRPVIRFALSCLDSRESAELEAFLWERSGGRLAFPYWPDATPLTSNAAMGATTLNLDTLTRSFNPAGAVIIWRDRTLWELVTVDTVASGSLGLALGTVNAWTADGQTYVIPVLFGHQTQAQDVVSIASFTKGAELTLECEPFDFSHGEGSAPIQYLGVDVLATEPNRAGELTGSFDRRAGVFDGKTGAVSLIDLTGMPIIGRRNCSFIYETRAEIAAFRTFRRLRKGKQKPFWFPTFNHDLPLNADQASGSTLVIYRVGYKDRMFSNPARRFLCIAINGTQYFREVLSVIEDATTETLTLDSAIPVAIPQTSVISFLVLSRLAVDDPPLTWKTLSVAEAILDIIEIPREVTA
jgi:hypothetical protein